MMTVVKAFPLSRQEFCCVLTSRFKVGEVVGLECSEIIHNL